MSSINSAPKEKPVHYGPECGWETAHFQIDAEITSLDVARKHRKSGHAAQPLELNALLPSEVPHPSPRYPAIDCRAAARAFAQARRGARADHHVDAWPIHRTLCTGKRTGLGCIRQSIETLRPWPGAHAAATIEPCDVVAPGGGDVMALHEQCVGATYEWYTPPYVFEALGCTFDVDVASPGAHITP